MQTAEVAQGPGTARQVRRVALTFVGLLVVVACMTTLFLSMRAVMDIGGSCASGGPYEIAKPCPQGVGWLLPASIWVGLIALGFYVAGVAHLPGPHLAALAWPALFLSLGWNFWEYGLDPPGGGDVVWAWVFCGALFVAMGAGPFLGMATPGALRALLWADAEPEVPVDAVGSTRAALAAKRTASAVRPRVGTATTGTDDLAEDLERLADLHELGKLTDSEFRAAKARRITGDGS